MKPKRKAKFDATNGNTLAFPTTENIKTLKVDGVEAELNRIEYETTKFTTSDKNLTYDNNFSYSGNFYKIETTLKKLFY